MGENGRKRVTLGYLAILSAAALWSLLGVTTRELEAFGMAPSQMGPWRALIGGFLFLIHAVVSHLRRVRAGKPTVKFQAIRERAGWVVGFGFFGVVVFYASLPLAIDAGGISLAFILMYTAPIWVAVGSVSVMGESMTHRDYVAIAVTVLGVAAVAASLGGTADLNWESLLWGLLTGISYASYYVLGRHLFGVIEPIVLYAMVLPLGGVVLALFVGIEWPPAEAWPWLIFLGVACTYLPFLFFSIGVTRVPPHRAIVAAMVEPVLAVFIGVLIYEERIGPIGIIGGAAVLVASLVTAISHARSHQEPVPGNA